MKVLFINVVCGIKSTGRICADLAQEMEANGHEVKIAYGRESVPEQYQRYAVHIGSDFDQKIHVLKTRLLDAHGLASVRATKRFLKWADEYNPDMLWLHNIHGYYINYELLFEWVKLRPEMQVRWTLHDCWAFTGHCSHFTMVKCEQWKTGCSYCVQKRRYPGCYGISRCKNNFERKKSAFTGVKNMTLITPSHWLADLVGESFLREYRTEVHYNTVNQDVFKPTASDFRERYGLSGKIIILGVASTWDERKGLNDFVKLANLLDDRYAVVLVGLSEKQKKAMPEKIRSLGRTNSGEELAAIYTAADLYLNLSREETFGMTTIEAGSCGTKTMVYEDTACEEVARNQGGTVVEQDVEYVKMAIEAEFATGVGGSNTRDVR